MRDYKNVRVPKKYRTAAKRASVKRVAVERGATGRGSRPGRTAARILVAAVVAAGCYIGWQAYRTIADAEFFQVSGVDFKGIRRLRGDELKEIAVILTGQNIFRLDLDAAEYKARSNPWVKDVRIYRSLPNRVSMAITERSPVALLDTGKAEYLIDSEGVVIERLVKDGAKARQLPRIKARHLHAAAGEKAASAGVESAIDLINELAGVGGWRLSDLTVQADSPETLAFIYEQNEFRVGIGNYTEKFRRAAEVMADIKQRNIRAAYIDLRPERQVAVMAAKNGVLVPGPRGKGKRL